MASSPSRSRPLHASPEYEAEIIRERVVDSLPLDRAVHLRRKQTPPEAILWSRVRAKRLGGLKFRRQHPIGVYVADLFCAEAGLVVEVDGERHAERVDQDQRRDEFMRRLGLTVYRVSVSRFMREQEKVLKEIEGMARGLIERRRTEKERNAKAKAERGESEKG